MAGELYEKVGELDEDFLRETISGGDGYLWNPLAQRWDGYELETGLLISWHAVAGAPEGFVDRIFTGATAEAVREIAHEGQGGPWMEEGEHLLREPAPLGRALLMDDAISALDRGYKPCTFGSAAERTRLRELFQEVDPAQEPNPYAGKCWLRAWPSGDARTPREGLLTLGQLQDDEAFRKGHVYEALARATGTYYQEHPIMSSDAANETYIDLAYAGSQDDEDYRDIFDNMAETICAAVWRDEALYDMVCAQPEAAGEVYDRASRKIGQWLEGTALVEDAAAYDIRMCGLEDVRWRVLSGWGDYGPCLGAENPAAVSIVCAAAREVADERQGRATLGTGLEASVEKKGRGDDVEER